MRLGISRLTVDYIHFDRTLRGLRHQAIGRILIFRSQGDFERWSVIGVEERGLKKLRATITGQLAKLVRNHVFVTNFVVFDKRLNEFEMSDCYLLRFDLEAFCKDSSQSYRSRPQSKPDQPRSPHLNIPTNFSNR